MSERLTLAQVTAQLEAANAAYEALACERDSLRAECEALRLLGTTARRVPAPAAAPVDRKAAMAAAREQAMATGRCVRAF